MTRWEPGAAERLAQAALDLYAENGFEQTTVAEIANQAGLTERTFFRHYADKREVLFAGSTQFQDPIVAAVEGAPESASPIDAVADGLRAGAGVLEPRRPFSRTRQTVIAANPELQERELIKLARLADALTAALRGRGVAEPTARLTAEAGIAVFRVAFERWIGEEESRELAALIEESLDELRAVTAGAR